MNGGELRFGRIDNRLNLCLLIRRQVQLLRDSLKAVAMPAPTAARARLCLHNHKAAKCYRTRGYKH
jgi:hypothetical protein